MTQPRVVVTGMGTVNPLGLNVEETWRNALAGVSGVGPVTRFDASDLEVQIGAEVKGFDPTQYMSAREARRLDLFEQFAVAAVREAVQQSGFEILAEESARTAVILSSAVGGIAAISSGVETLLTDGPRRISPFLIPMFMPNGAAGQVGIDLGIRGPSYSISSACASGADGIGNAWMLMRAGVVDAALAGASEATVTRLGVAAFDRVGALSRRNADYSATPRPFDRDRDGLVIGEGAAVLLLERLDRAEKRGAPIMAELVGYASTADAHHITAPVEDGAGGSAAIAQALQSAGLQPEEVDYINAHGTGTVLNDLAETRAIKAALGEAAYDIPISSTKSMTGHIMGATAALEAIFAILAIRHDTIPPTINLENPDPELDLDYVPGEARAVRVRVALTNAFGFGGHNAVLVFREYSG